MSLLVLLLSQLLTAPAAWAANPSAAAPQGQPLERALNPDGSLKPGLDGSFDASGYRLTTAANGKPAFRPLGTTGVGDENWQDGFGLPGVFGAVFAILQNGNDIYIGGDFTAVGTTRAKSIAKWNGRSWSALGTGVNTTGSRTNSGSVHALAMSGTDLYVGGNFTEAGGVVARGIAKWNGSTWSPLGAGMSGPVYALAVSGPDVYVGGSFATAGDVAASNIARWHGNAWNALGAGVSNLPSVIGSEVRAIAVSGPDVYVGGQFATAGSTAANNIAKWNGSAWSTLGIGVTSNGPSNYRMGVYALAVSGPDVYVGGQFNNAGPVTASNIARWNGSTWSSLGNGLNGTAYALAVSGTSVYVGGWFTSAGSVACRKVARWNGSAWNALGNGPGTGSTDIARTLLINGNEVYAGGLFITEDNSQTFRLAKWNGSAWNQVGPGLNNKIVALAVSGADVYVGGSFTTAGEVVASYIAKWNGRTWSSLGNGLNGPVNALAVSGPDVYAGGRFTAAGGVAARNIARWNGSTWSPLGTGTDDEVLALAVSGSDLYAGGSFATAGGVAASYIARWNGGAWSPLGAGTDSQVRALAVMSGELYAGGSFATAGGLSVGYIAKWDGSTWSTLGAGITFGGTPGHPLRGVWALAVSGSDLYAGGTFAMAGNLAASNIARWNGSTWLPLSGGVPPAGTRGVFALATNGSDLYVGGGFGMVSGGMPASNTAKWDGRNWSPLGSGLNDDVYALAASGSAVYAGGQFTTVGDGSKVTGYFGVYRPDAVLSTAPPRASASTLTLSPNPTDGAATLRGAAPQAKVQVLDARGRLVLTALTDATGTARLRLPARLPAGVYLVRCGSQALRLLRE